MIVKDSSCKYNDLYCKKLPDDASDVVLMFNRSSGQFYHNLNTGEQSQELLDVVRKEYPYIILKKSSRPKLGFFVEYDDEYDVLIIRPVELAINTIPKIGEKRYWRKIGHSNWCYIFDRNGNANVPYLNTDYGPSKFQYFVDVYASNNGTGEYCNFYEIHKKSTSIIRAFVGNMFCGTALNYYPSSTDYLQELLKMTPIKILSKQVLVDEILGHELGCISDDDRNNMFNILTKYWESLNGRIHNNSYLNQYYFFSGGRFSKNIAIIEKVTEGVAVIRQFQIVVDSNTIDNPRIELVEDVNQTFIHETVRIYITDNDFFVCKNMFGKWILCKKGLFVEYFDFFLIRADEDAMSSTKMKYFKQNVQDCLKNTLELDDVADNQNNREFGFLAKSSAQRLYSILSSSIYESVIKSGYECFQNLVMYGLSSPESILRDCFGNLDLKQNNFIKATGLPSYMFKILNKHWLNLDNIQDKYTGARKRWCIRAIMFFRKAFQDNEEYLRRLDSETFDEMLSIYEKYFVFNEKMFFSNQRLCDMLKNLISINGPKNILGYMKQILVAGKIGNEKHFIDEESYLEPVDYRLTSTYLRLYDDYLYMCSCLKEELSNIPYKFKTSQELKSAHDNITMVYTIKEEQQKEEELKEKLIKLKDKWQKLEYSEEDFSIVAPTAFYDIANEGLILHHCVKSYIDAVANGKTVIMFVRRSNDLTTPFFTLEVNHKAIRQCHGFANCNTDTIEGLDDFLKRFCENKKIKYSEGTDILAVRI